MDESNDPRVYFAAERTLLAWMRTGITVIGLGFVVARFGLFLQILRHDPSPGQPSRLDADRRRPRAVGIGGGVDGRLAARAILPQSPPARPAPRTVSELVGLVLRDALGCRTRAGRIHSTAVWHAS